MGTEEHNSKTRPSRPSWGNEISRPSESLELINKKIFHVSTSNSEDPQIVSSNLSDSAKHLSPLEEYLRMTMRLIASKSLSPRTSVILKDLYVKYKSNWGYNSNIDINREDWIKVIEHDDAYKETFAHLEKKKGSKENSSTSKKEQLETESRTLVKTKIPMEDTESPWFTLQTVQDSSFERPCSEIIQINDVFSDFSLADAGHDKTMKELVKQWMTKEERFLFIVLAALLAVANAGGPAAYDIATASGDLSSIGFSQESTQKGLGGQNVISSYTKSDDSAHSFVRVSSHSISNDALLNYDISHTYAAPYSYASAAPVIAKTAIAPAPLLAKTYAAPVAAAPLLAKSYAAPVAAAPLLTKTYAAPLLAKTYAAPLLAKTYTAPVAAAPLLAKTYAAPVAAAPLLAKTYAAPAYAATPLLAKTYAAAAPLSYAASTAPLSYAASAAPLSYAAPAAPLLAKSYGYTSYVPTIDKIAPAHGFAAASIAPAPLHSYAASKTYGYEHIPYSHTSFSGFGTSYAW
ncbi:Cuticle protein 21.3 [Melipona quadrifasciata]|uniref:Cuticle protein 21.3 n=1 Tax=Melipona quadrifasciata TaxID=166423 RepID=A0A0M9A544_9HYME|nr:Cuticle protein 21.3 [Melipona quadrifasciata]